MRKVVLIGANGQLGHDLCGVIAGCSNRLDLIPLTHADIEITDRRSVEAMLDELKPQVVINTAAFHRVDDCEDQPGRTFAVNGEAVRGLAESCGARDILLVHMSTDYVFGGEDSRRVPYRETDAPFPINVYGVSKLAGEYFVRSLARRHVVVRTSGLYGTAGSSGKGGNFVELMVRLAREERPIRVVDDQRLSPTYTHDLAQKIVELIGSDGYGIYHVTSDGECSWYEFATAIFAACGLAPHVAAVPSAVFEARARRPAYSVLDKAALRHAGLAILRPWQDALADYLARKGYLRA
jgi:dTDP-4-dehydrorhamnose reductase